MASNSNLDKAISEYLLWLIDTGYAESTIYHYERMLNHFRKYVGSNADSLDVALSRENITAYEKKCTLKGCTVSIWGIARYLYKQGKLTKLPGRKPKDLPILCETYLSDSQINGSISAQRIAGCRKTLTLLSGWLTRQGCELQQLRIEHVDHFLSAISKNYAPATMQRHRSSLRGFLGWLYQNTVTRRNLALLVDGPPQYAAAKPPRFLRADDIKKLFMAVPVTQCEQRTLAMLHLAYYLGLRPVEISRISLDDIQFSKQEILISTRKSCNPIRVPLPTTAIKAIADYVINVRPESDSRKLFLGLRAPYEPVKSISVCSCIAAWMRKAGTPGSAYWLRHTYAQNLLEAKASIFEVKEMLGHDRIQTTSLYLRIHITMMREVLFNETL